MYIGSRPMNGAVNKHARWINPIEGIVDDIAIDIEANINNNDPDAQLEGLMSAQNSLHRLSTMANKSKEGKIKDLA